MKQLVSKVVISVTVLGTAAIFGSQYSIPSAKADTGMNASGSIQVAPNPSDPSTMIPTLQSIPSAIHSQMKLPTGLSQVLPDNSPTLPSLPPLQLPDKPPITLLTPPSALPNLPVNVPTGSSLPSLPLPDLSKLPLPQLPTTSTTTLPNQNTTLSSQSTTPTTQSSKPSNQSSTQTNQGTTPTTQTTASANLPTTETQTSSSPATTNSASDPFNDNSYVADTTSPVTGMPFRMIAIIGAALAGMGLGWLYFLKKRRATIHE